MAHGSITSVDSVIYHEVIGVGSCTLDELLERLPAFSWVQVFEAVDRLSRQGTLTLGRGNSCGYVLSISRHSPHPQSSQERTSQPSLATQTGCSF